ncbi:hypothetical protein [Streptomyces chrestomyceticus]|uniref:hypothetical protein n=1 Tax=Streptomyces chrestomyceticus TaxID=68185 RepID=UPI000F623555|nr:hypothetical protein [Streptomyces chrestomyceticus]
MECSSAGRAMRQARRFRRAPRITSKAITGPDDATGVTDVPDVTVRQTDNATDVTERQVSNATDVTDRQHAEPVDAPTHAIRRTSRYARPDDAPG